MTICTLVHYQIVELPNSGPWLSVQWDVSLVDPRALCPWRCPIEEYIVCCPITPPWQCPWPSVLGAVPKNKTLLFSPMQNAWLTVP